MSYGSSNSSKITGKPSNLTETTKSDIGFPTILPPQKPVTMNTHTLLQKPINMLPSPLVHQQKPVNMFAPTAECLQKPVNMIKTSTPLQQNPVGSSNHLLKQSTLITTKTLQSTVITVGMADEKNTENISIGYKTTVETIAVPSVTTANEDMGKHTTEKSYLNQSKFTSESYEKTSKSHSIKFRNSTTQKMGGESVFKLLKHEIQNANIICHV